MQKKLGMCKNQERNLLFVVFDAINKNCSFFNPRKKTGCRIVKTEK